jgi:hypothetical protein
MRSRKRPRQFHNSNATTRKHPVVRPAPEVASITTVRSPSKRNCPIHQPVPSRDEASGACRHFGTIQPCAPNSPASFGYGFHNQLQSGSSTSLSGIPRRTVVTSTPSSRDYPWWPRKPYALKSTPSVGPHPVDDQSARVRCCVTLTISPTIYRAGQDRFDMALG